MSIVWEIVKFVAYSFLLLILGFLIGIQESVEQSRQEIVVIEDCREGEKSY